MEKDIPFLQKIMPKKFTAAYMKGRSNYACLYKIKKAEHQPILEGLDEMDYFDEVRGWSRETETGDRAELVAGSLDELGQAGKNGRGVAACDGRFADGQGDFTLGHGKTRQRIHDQEDVPALIERLGQ